MSGPSLGDHQAVAHRTPSLLRRWMEPLLLANVVNY